MTVMHRIVIGIRNISMLIISSEYSFVIIWGLEVALLELGSCCSSMSYTV